MRAMVTDHRLRLKKTLDLPNGIIEGVGGHFDRKWEKEETLMRPDIARSVAAGFKRSRKPAVLFDN